MLETTARPGDRGAALARRPRRSHLVLLTLVGSLTGWLLITFPVGASAPPVYYLALGDSAPVWNGPNSYPDQITSDYAAGLPGLQLDNLAQSGATTASFLQGPNSQEQQAMQFLQAHQDSMALITIDIGGNDVLPCVNGLSVDIACLQQAETTMVTNLNTILGGIREAAGPSVPLVGMTYYDPFLGDWLAGGSTQELATLSVTLATQLNSLLTQTYEQYNAHVADVASAFDITDLTDQVSSPWGEIPVAVDKACTLLDIICMAGQPEGFGDDPDDAGATVIAQTFEQTIGPTIMPVTTSTTTPSESTTTSPSPTTTSSTTTPSTLPTLPGNSASPPTTSTTSSGSLAFTGVGTGEALMGTVGLTTLLAGVLILIATDAPERLRRKSMPTGDPGR
jgi:lysophospholipase L1-like esterase